VCGHEHCSWFTPLKGRPPLVKRFSDFKKEFFDKRRTEVLCRELSPASYRSDEIRFGKLEPSFTAQPFKEITQRWCDRYLDSLILDGKSPATRNRYRALLHTYFEYAIDHGYCKDNPLARIAGLSEKVKVRKTDFWTTPKEAEKYVRTAFRFGVGVGLGASILALGGCRIGEMLAVHWEDVMWRQGYIRIRRIVERHTNTICERTKGQKAGGEYQILMTPELERILRKYRKKTGLIVCQLTSKHLSYDQYYKLHWKIIARAKLKEITPHDIRRTFATHAGRAGFHRREVGELLGHETMEATEVYMEPDFSHLIQKARRLKFGRVKRRK
jgi:integrase